MDKFVCATQEDDVVVSLRPQAFYILLASRAAASERLRTWGNAALLWQQASRYARATENKYWAQVRAEYCRHQSGERVPRPHSAQKS